MKNHTKINEIGGQSRWKTPKNLRSQIRVFGSISVQNRDYTCIIEGGNGYRHEEEEETKRMWVVAQIGVAGAERTPAKRGRSGFFMKKEEE